MKTENITSQDALKWYVAMGVDSVISCDANRWDNTEQSLPESKILAKINKSNNLKASASREIANSCDTLDKLEDAVLFFEECDLKKTSTNTVFADGSKTAKIMLIGEAPGASEDEQGIPFCGASGQLLDNIISTIGLSRKNNVYITNTVFWRPPANRRPTEEEIEICRPFVEKHIALIKPQLLILVGSTAVTSLLGDCEISKIRQQYYQYKNQYLDKSITTTAIFHPAYLLRQPFQKKAMWYDLLKIKDFLDSSVNKHQI